VPDKEKAEYEGEEKEDSLRFIDQSISEDSILVQSIILSRAASCDYLELCNKFMQHLGLPGLKRTFQTKKNKCFKIKKKGKDFFCFIFVVI